MLEPLKQFICDDCEQNIEKLKDGCVEWLQDRDSNNFSFRIVHHASASPRRPGGNCYQHEPAGATRMNLHLDSFIEIAPIELLNYLDPQFNQRRKIKDYNNFVDTYRRLTLPYYEEAKRYWGKASRDGFFNDMNEVSMFLPDTLKTLIDKYKS